jgi:hypothetical protein
VPGSPEGKPSRAEEALVRVKGKLAVGILTKAFDKNLELAFREGTSVAERLAVTAGALGPIGVSEDLIVEASLPGAFSGYIQLPSEPDALLFVRYGTLVLAAEPNGEVSLADPRATWAVLASLRPSRTPPLTGLRSASPSPDPS